ncbi:hypothetical protein B0H17DRAFT_1151575 [Mycena rosella]|uniref:Uncharacterized protein n=1 Tax=Mycena rosella TaxID=1033263 RepID=A0AAD7BJ87_MYCRO|nr:hypothetical protein B0H17DRAFT_1151575 [Mycena rosella]
MCRAHGARTQHFRATVAACAPKKCEKTGAPTLAPAREGGWNQGACRRHAVLDSVEPEASGRGNKKARRRHPSGSPQWAGASMQARSHARGQNSTALCPPAVRATVDWARAKLVKLSRRKRRAAAGAMRQKRSAPPRNRGSAEEQGLRCTAAPRCEVDGCGGGGWHRSFEKERSRAAAKCTGAQRSGTTVTTGETDVGDVIGSGRMVDGTTGGGRAQVLD